MQPTCAMECLRSPEAIWRSSCRLMERPAADRAARRAGRDRLPLETSLSASVLSTKVSGTFRPDEPVRAATVCPHSSSCNQNSIITDLCGLRRHRVGATLHLHVMRLATR